MKRGEKCLKSLCFISYHGKLQCVLSNTCSLHQVKYFLFSFTTNPHLLILLILVLLALQSWNSENYFTSDWKGDTWKIFLYLSEYFLGLGASPQCPVWCELTRGESLCSGGWDWGGGDLSIYIIISDTNTTHQYVGTMYVPTTTNLLCIYYSHCNQKMDSVHVAYKENVSLKAALLNLPVLAKLQSLVAAAEVCSNEVPYLPQWFSVVPPLPPSLT